MQERSAIVSYALNYFCAFGLVAFFMGFLPLHWRAIGLDPFDISLIMAVANLSALLAAPFFMRYLAKYLSPPTIFNLAALGALLSFLCLFFVRELPECLLAILAFTFFWNGTLIQNDAHAVYESASGRFRFERLRLWGSAGFIAFSYLFGICIDKFGVECVLKVGLAITVVMFFTSVNLSRHLTAPYKTEELSEEKHPFPWQLALRFTFCVGLCWLSHSALYLYFSLYLQSLGWSATAISVAWNLGVGAEMLMFLNFHHLERHASMLTIMRLSLALTILRWLALGSSQSAWIIYPTQILHAFTFASFHIASIKLVYRMLPKNQRVSGQAMLISWAGSSGSFLGRLAIGWLAMGISAAGEFQVLFLYCGIAAALSLVATVLLSSESKTATYQ